MVSSSARKSVHVVKSGNYKRLPGEYEVEKILDVKVVDGSEQFLVKWKDHDDSHNTWEPVGNLACPRILHEFFLQRSLAEEKIVDVEVNSDKPYGFERGLAPTCITGVTKVDEELYFLIKWKGRKDPDVVPATQANVRCPQLVIGFYESILYFE
uniref:Chromobox protein homolog 3 n=1 Tax=Schistocephalus solidus TaxID=70667 RepID=A0A0X3Q5C8_SCHSO